MPTWSMLSFQDSASPIMEHLTMFHDFTMAIMTLILTLVGLNLTTLCLFNLTDRYLLQDQIIEITWTMAPVFILLWITLPSLQVLYLLDDPFTPDMTVKAIGNQWFWSYEYSDFPNIEFESYMSPLSQDTLFFSRLLETDNSLVLPTNTKIRLIATSNDVIHAWALPSLGVKADAVPGRLNSLSFLINRVGSFYGQCSEICGSNHSFMPIKIEAVPMNIFLTWASSWPIKS
uniref:Cytochrome c oxidase subunit 2 n=1 Tax=Pseudocrangonyx daejeonensis TaxID=2038767 RepID=A0A346SAF6_9CRUS|nr:cytochrome c oxidase subunit II [Pseudocrangonyx daejeonensis]AXT17544.1 cytochrome oxidase subunit 2 [Pseudocrangonyx daejeonensis]